MKYFVNFPYTAESLKNEFRALSLKLHPDTGGNAEEFAAMLNEYEQTARNLDGTKQHAQQEEARQEAERARREREEEERERKEYEAREKARREREEAEERERIRKAQEVTRAAVRAWASILERIPEGVTAKKRAYDFADDKARAAYVAATKRNVKAVINHYFPGLKVTVSISGRIWREDFTISWQDGPSIKELRDTCEELQFFVPTFFESDPYTDYGTYSTREESAPWREAYGQALGDVTKIDFTRGLSDEGKQQAEQLAAQFFANFDPESEAETFAANLEELGKLAQAAGFYESNLTNIFRSLTGNYYGDMYGVWSEIKGEVNRRQLRKMLAEHVRVNVTPKEKAPEFVPTYGPVYKTIKKALGANVFYIEVGTSRKNSEQELTIFEAAERLARGEAVQLGKRSTFDGDPVIYGTDRGGYKTQQKRAEKFEAVGIILDGVSYNTYGHINAQGIKPETLEALRREFADIENQRKAWEAEQEAGKKAQESAKEQQPTNTKAKRQESTTANETQPETTTAEAPAEGLQLIETAEGVAVVSDDWKTTYFNKKHIKAHGCHWNKDAKRWEATDPADVLKVRAWFALRDGFGPFEEKTDEEIKAEAAEEIAAEEEQARQFAEAFATVADTMHQAATANTLEGFTQPKPEAEAEPEPEPEPVPHQESDGREVFAFVLLVSGKISRVLGSYWCGSRHDAARYSEGLCIGAKAFRDSAAVAVYQLFTNGRYYFVFGKNLTGRDIFPAAAKIEGATFEALEDEAPTAQQSDREPQTATERPTEGAQAADPDNTQNGSQNATTATTNSASDAAPTETQGAPYEKPPRIRFDPSDYSEAA